MLINFHSCLYYQESNHPFLFDSSGGRIFSTNSNVRSTFDSHGWLGNWQEHDAEFPTF